MAEFLKPSVKHTAKRAFDYTTPEPEIPQKDAKDKEIGELKRANEVLLNHIEIQNDVIFDLRERLKTLTRSGPQMYNYASHTACLTNTGGKRPMQAYLYSTTANAKYFKRTHAHETGASIHTTDAVSWDEFIEANFPKRTDLKEVKRNT